MTALGAQVVGVSVDDGKSHAEFAQKYHLPFPLLADSDKEVAARYGPTRLDGEWLYVGGIAEARVPELVAELVARGAAIHAVVPTRHSLEERFMSLLATPTDGGDAAGSGGEAAAVSEPGTGGSGGRP